jgi:probable HAF family extracellular repeat protein
MIPLNRSSNPIFRSLRGAAARCLLATVPLALAPAAHAEYNLIFVPDPSGTDFINLLGINNSLTVAGFDDSTFNQGVTVKLPSLTFSSPIFFPPSGTLATMVTGINDSGDLSGIYVTSTGVNHGFTWIGGVFTTVDNPASTVFNQALDINNSDETVGYYTLEPSGAPGDVSYSQKGGVFTAVAGLPSNVNNQAVGLNNSGEIVGFYQPTSAPSESFGYLDDGGTITTIDPFGSTFVSANGINDEGDIVGTYQNGSGATLGFVWTPGGGYRSFDIAGSTLTDINSINNKGDIVGFYTDAAGATIGFVGSPIPEPSTWAMMLAGFAGLGFLGYRRRSRGPGRPESYCKSR